MELGTCREGRITKFVVAELDRKRVEAIDSRELLGHVATLADFD